MFKLYSDMKSVYFNLQKEYEPKDVFEETTKPKETARQGNYVPVSLTHSALDLITMHYDTITLD